MLSGTSVMSFTSSPDVFAGTMSLASVPQEVSAHVKIEPTLSRASCHESR
jgi:hypothetical protein